MRQPGRYSQVVKLVFHLQISRRTVLIQKEVDDVLGGENAWKNVDKTEGETVGGNISRQDTECLRCSTRSQQFKLKLSCIGVRRCRGLPWCCWLHRAVIQRTHVSLFPAAQCPKCGYSQAYFMQIQIRSADEPMSTFYKCVNVKCNHRWRDG